MNEERLKGQLCDVHLIVGDQKFRAHKNVLAASSEYFHALFTNKDNEVQTVFQLDFCEPDAFDNVLNYIYSSSLFVEKSSLAAVQELGYSLGISFLTNILSKTPQAPFSSCSNKKTFFQDDDESSSQQRSVIVRQSRSEIQEKYLNNTQHDIGCCSKPSPTFTVKSNTSRLHSTRTMEPLLGSPSGERRELPENSAAGYTKLLDPPRSIDTQNRSCWVRGDDTVEPRSQKDKETPDEKGSPYLKGKTMDNPSKRQDSASTASLRGSVESPYLFHHTGKETHLDQKDDRNLLYFSKLGLVVPAGGSVSDNQNIDRSGPLVKSLLRRSLSMDSQVPAYLSSVDLQPLSDSLPDNRSAESLHDERKLSTSDNIEKLSIIDKAQVRQPHRLRSFSASHSTNEVDASTVTEVQIKTEPNSPLSEPSDPSEILRVTVGDSSTSSTRDFLLKTEESHRNLGKFSFKRRFQADIRRQISKRFKIKESSLMMSQGHIAEGSSPSHLNADFAESDDDKEDFIELEDMRPNKKFKCKHCLKIFRSTAGLHRHMNMYHNPEKPYACDICHKRFHTNFKVWTHCQTQHGIVKNPSPATSSHAVLDEKFQRKLIDIVREREIKKAREREIKKALIGKLRRSKQGYPGPSNSQIQVMKRNLRSRNKGSYICSYCGKAYRFLSQFKQHIKMHPGEKPNGNKPIKPKELAHNESPFQNKETYQCRHCNAKLYSLIELGNHERLCRNITVCPYCSLRFSSPDMKHDHENRCEYKKLTCLECMRTFKSSFSIWRHQVEVHNQNTMAPTENFSLPGLDHNGEISSSVTSYIPRVQSLPESIKMNNIASIKDDSTFSDSSEQLNFDSEDSSYLPEDLSISKHFNIKIKEEPPDDIPDDIEDEMCEGSLEPKEEISDKESGIWSCEKCGKMFTVHKQLERHQELLCSVKPFICHVCNKAFRTNFRLWSHFQSHMPHAEEEAPYKDPEPCLPAKSPSPPPLPPPPPPPPPPPLIPKIQTVKPESPTSFPESPNTSEKLFVPQEPDTLFYHAPPLSAITFKRQYMCKLCHRTFKTAFSLWSHEQTHN